jgi:hypothetical protein
VEHTSIHARTFENVFLAENAKLAERFDVLAKVELAAIVFVNQRKDGVAEFRVFFVNAFVELSPVDRAAFAFIRRVASGWSAWSRIKSSGDWGRGRTTATTTS